MQAKLGTVVLHIEVLSSSDRCSVMVRYWER